MAFYGIQPGPLVIQTDTSTDTVLMTQNKSGVPETSDADVNPYSTSGGATKTVLIDGGNDLVSQNVGGMKLALGPWTRINIATSVPATTLISLCAIAGSTSIAMPYAGSIIGVSGVLNTHITAGTLRVCVAKNGSTVFSAVNAATTVVAVHGTQNKDVDTFAAGDRLGIRLITSADLAPTTAEGVFALFVEV